MSILKTKPADEDVSLLVDVAIELCRFANGSCECRERGRRTCERAEFAASKVIGLVTKHIGGAA